MKTLVHLLLAVLLIFYLSPAFAESTQEMLSACRSIAKAKVSADNVNLPQDFSTGECWGAFIVVQKVIVLIDETNIPIHRVCAPANSTRAQLISIFVDYAEKNPQRLHEDFFYVAIDSLRMAFPCKPKR